MKHLPLILASKSPARLATLRAAGIEPEVRVSHVDEPAVLSQVRGGPGQQVLALATAKARAVLGFRGFFADDGNSLPHPRLRFHVRIRWAGLWQATYP